MKGKKNPANFLCICLWWPWDSKRIFRGKRMEKRGLQYKLVSLWSLWGISQLLVPTFWVLFLFGVWFGLGFLATIKLHKDNDKWQVIEAAFNRRKKSCVIQLRKKKLIWNNNALIGTCKAIYNGKAWIYKKAAICVTL